MKKKLNFLILILLLTTSCADPIQDNLFPTNTGSDVQNIEKRQSNQSCTAPPNAIEQYELGFERYFPTINFELPLGMVQKPNDNNFWYILEKGGKVFEIENNPQASEKVLFADFSEVIVTNIEAGLLSLAFHPDFENNGKIYVYYSGPVNGVDYENCPAFACPTTGVLSEFLINNEGTQIDIDSEKVLISFEKPSEIHFGGGMFFGPDGYLYLSIGDGSTVSAESPAQDLFDIKGKLVRIDVDVGDPYSIPDDNPFFMGGGLPEIYALGFRNPWRWSFDRETGNIWVGDVGNTNIEEINLVEIGGNYGWPIFEGNSCRYDELCVSGDFLTPITYYTHDDGCAVIGGYVYRGADIPDLYGTYIFGDLCNGNIFGFPSENNDGESPVLFNVMNETLFSFAEDQNGELFTINGDVGSIYRITNFQINQGEILPEKISEIGCFQKENLNKSKQGVYPYMVNVPLWSDGAEKDRWLAIPDESYIEIANDGKWSFPVGSVLIKSFSINDKLIETRFFMNHENDGWKGYSYEWNSEQTEAFLVDPSGKEIILPNEQKWVIPSRSQCFSCHTNAAGKVLGLENNQINRLFHNSKTGLQENQIEYFNKIGMFDESVENNISTFSSFPIFNNNFPDESEIESYARAYLHVNCSMCHRPQGPGVGPANFLSSIPFNDMNICNVNPSITNLGINGAKLLSPQNPDLSIIWHRMNSLDENRMPAIGTHLIDEFGVNLIQNWIEGVETCTE